METLLPSEVARLVLGYLEGENCEDAAKCFLNTSQHLSEYRLMAQKGKRYPTKVNGYSLKEVLEEYCLVHSIVQESLTSMTDQPNVGGNMIESLRFLVRACQPVQVHINLHPQQGQGVSSGSKSEVSDIAVSSRPRTKKITSLGQTSGSLHGCPNSESALSQSLPESAPLQICVPISKSNSLSAPDLSNPQTSNLVAFQGIQNLLQSANSNSNPELAVTGVTDSRCLEDSRQVIHLEKKSLLEDGGVPSQEVFQEENVDTYHKPSPLATAQFSETPNVTIKNSPGVHVPGVNSKDSAALSLNQDLAPQCQQSMNMNSSEPQGAPGNFEKPDEPIRSFTITKCHGSSIVILDNSDPQACSTSSSATNLNSFHEGDIRKQPSKSVLTSPEKATVLEQMSEKMIKSETMVSKLVENINRVWTPAKQLQPRNEDFQALGENPQCLDEAVHSILKETEEDPCFDQFLREFLQFDGDKHPSSIESEEDSIDGSKCSKKKRRAPKKKAQGSVTKLKHLCENAVSNLSVDKGSGGNSEFATSVATTATPAKVCVETDTMTPMTKLLKSITSPSGDLYLDPTQFAGLLDIPSSAVKINDSDVPSTSAAPTQLQQAQPVCGSESSSNNVIQVSQPNGTTVNVPIVFCESNQQVAQYVNEKGVSTIFTGEIQVMPMPHHGSYVPIVPKLKPGVPFPAVYFAPPEVPQAKLKKRPRSKQVRTRGGRQAAGQIRYLPNEQSDSKNTVTLYAADEEEEVSSIVSYSGCSDLPILISDTVDVPSAVESQNLNVEQNKPGDSRLLETESADNVVESKDDISAIEEDINLPLLNASTTRNTPGVSGLGRPTTKRISLSTPRRRLSHIRALDFNTPPKESDQSLRRANTSPKNMSSNALSPHTSGKSIKTSFREGLFKAPSTSSKVKAHLFKSPEYLMNQSSGFKVPSAAATSTPGEESPLPRPSGAWDKIGGVSLILESESELSPVKHSEPTCKRKVLKSWDADLRSSLGDVEPDSLPSKKRKAAAPPPTTQNKKGDKKCKKSQVRRGKAKSNEDEDKSRNTSSESAGEMAKILEQNLMNDSSGMVSSPIKSSPSKIKISNTPCKLTAGGTSSVSTDKSSTPSTKQRPAKKTRNDNVILNEKPAQESSSVPQNFEEGNITVLSETGRSDIEMENNNNPEDGLILIANAAVRICEETKSKMVSDVKETSVVCKTLNVENKTPLSDPLAASAVDKIRLQKATWAESLSFETPVKDESVNVIPQTPQFAFPGSACKEDTPRTKIIKALPFSLLPISENPVGTPTLSVPPTPSIRTSPIVSPNCPPYFQPMQESPLVVSSKQIGNTLAVSTSDSLENILVKECSRIEAGGMRESLKKISNKFSESKLGRPGCYSKEDGKEENVEDLDIAERSIESVNEVASIDNSVSKTKNGGKAMSSPPSHPGKDQDSESSGCARCQQYKPKLKDNKQMTSREWANNVKKKDGSSADETEDCVIISPQKKLQKARDTVSEKATEAGVKVIELSPVTSEVNSSHEPLPSTPAPSAFDVPTKGIQEAGENSPKICPKSIILAVSSSHDETVNLRQEESVPEDGSSLVSGAMPHDVKASLEKASLATPVEAAQSSLEANGSSCQKKGDDMKKTEQMVTDNDESSDSSSADSSSDSSSDSTSSSSEDENSPVKENVSHSVLSSLKTRSSCISDKHLPEIESCESSQPDPTQDKTENLVVRQSTKVHEAPTNVELRSLLESKTTNFMESMSTSNSPLNAVGFITELEQKRRRTVEQFKNGTPKQRISKISKQQSVVATISSSKTTMSSNNILTVKVVERNTTKDTAMAEELPKKKGSTLETSATETKQEIKHQSEKKKSASDGEKISDEDEFQLHLSGDEKEASPQRSTVLDSVEMQLAALHGDNLTQVKSTSEPMSRRTSTERVRAEDKSATGTRSNPPSKLSSTKNISSKSADAVIKSLWEKGFGCTLPRPPPEKIKKMVSVAGSSETKHKPDEKSRTSIGGSLKQLVPEVPQPLLKTKSKSNEKSGRFETDVLDHEADEEACTDIINTSISNNSLDIRIFYKGLGCLKQKVDCVVLKRLRISLEGGTDVCLSPSPLISLYSRTPKVQQDEIGSVSRKNQKSGDCRAENLSFRTDSSKRYHDDLNDGEMQSRYSRYRNSGDRVSRRHEEYRSRRIRSPSPRFRRSCDYGDNYSHFQGSHRNHDSLSLSRRASHPRRYDSNSAYGKRGSDSELRSVVSLSQKPKVSDKVDVEDGELSSSDSEAETKRGKSKEAAVKSGKIKTVNEKKFRNSFPVKTSISPSRDKSRRISQPQSSQHHISLRQNPCYEKEDSKNKGHCSSALRQAEKLERSMKVKCADEDINDADLDSENFPVLGEDDANENYFKDCEQNFSIDTDENSKLPLRRAPPRQVNAHKFPSENKTPTQRGKRKLSTSPDAVSEDSCQGSLGPLVTDSKAERSSRRSKKISSDLVPVSKILKLNEEKGAVERDIIKDLNVDMFLDKIHPPQLRHL